VASLVFALCATPSPAASPVQQLPPKKKKASQAENLGESAAVDEVKRMTEVGLGEEPADRANVTGAVAPVMISPAAVQSLGAESNTASAPDAKKAEADEKVQVTSTELTSEKPAQAELPQSKLWLVLKKKPELGFMTGWAFARKELSTLVGDGFSYGFLAAQEIVPGVQGQLRVSGTHHREQTASRKSSLNLFPFEVLAQFSRQVGAVRFYVQPGLGGALWNSRSIRLIDQREKRAKGFDFMASGGLGFKYKMPEQPWSLGADASMAYVSGYFDNYFTRVLVYTTYQF